MVQHGEHRELVQLPPGEGVCRDKLGRGRRRVHVHLERTTREAHVEPVVCTVSNRHHACTHRGGRSQSHAASCSPGASPQSPSSILQRNGPFEFVESAEGRARLPRALPRHRISFPFTPFTPFHNQQRNAASLAAIHCTLALLHSPSLLHAPSAICHLHLPWPSAAQLRHFL